MYVHKDFCDMAALAWHVTKGQGDPELPNCALDHQFKMAFKVESVHKSGVKEDRFDQIAAQLLSLPRPLWVLLIQSLIVETETASGQGIAVTAAPSEPPNFADGSGFKGYVDPAAIASLAEGAHPFHGDEIALEEAAPSPEIQDEPEKYATKEKPKRRNSK